jgi:hypothetical protein
VTGYCGAACAAFSMVGARPLPELTVAAAAYVGARALTGPAASARLPAHRGRRRHRGYGLAACLFTGTASQPAAYAGAFLWGAAGSVFGAVAVTTVQQVAPVHAHGPVMSISATLQS